MGRRRSSRYRDSAEYAGARFYPSPVVCPKCGGACRSLLTDRLRKPRGIECTVCNWSQYPGNAPPLGPTKENAPCRSEPGSKNSEPAPNSSNDSGSSPADAAGGP